MSRRYDVLTVGIQTVDVLVTGLDAGILDRQITAPDAVRVALGGDALNQAVALAHLGARTALMGAVGGGRFGALLLDLLSREPITVLDRRLEAPDAVCVVLIGRDGERHFLYQPGPNDALDLGSLDLGAVAEAGIVSVGGGLGMRAMNGGDTARLLAAARRAGAVTAMDLRLREASYDPAALREVFGLVDYLLPSEEEAALLTGETEPARMAAGLRALGAAHCVVKLGGRGCYVSAGGVEAAIPALPSRCVDATGAGDTFVGAFLYGLSRGWGAEDCARFANAAGSLAVEHVGANGAIRSEAQVRARMAAG